MVACQPGKSPATPFYLIDLLLEPDNFLLHASHASTLVYSPVWWFKGGPFLLLQLFTLNTSVILS